MARTDDIVMMNKEGSNNSTASPNRSSSSSSSNILMHRSLSESDFIRMRRRSLSSSPRMITEADQHHSSLWKLQQDNDEPPQPITSSLKSLLLLPLTSREEQHKQQPEAQHKQEPSGKGGARKFNQRSRMLSMPDEHSSTSSREFFPTVKKKNLNPKPVSFAEQEANGEDEGTTRVEQEYHEDVLTAAATSEEATTSADKNNTTTTNPSSTTKIITSTTPSTPTTSPTPEDYAAAAVEQQEQQASLPPHPIPHLLTPEEQEHVQYLLDHHNWDDLLELLEEHPEMARAQVKLVVQGENCFVTPLHYVASCCGNVDVLEALVTAYPQALETPEDETFHHHNSTLERWPIHMALVKGTTYATIKYLVKACKISCQQPDRNGYFPLHYAVSNYYKHSDPRIVSCILEAYPDAASFVTKDDRKQSVLHLLVKNGNSGSTGSSRSLKKRDDEDNHDDDDDLFLQVARDVVKAYPDSLQLLDQHQGRLPLHVAAASLYPNWKLLQYLCDEYEHGLLIPDGDNMLPVQLCRKLTRSSSFSSKNHGQHGHDDHDNNNVVVALLQDRTNLARRNHRRQLKTRAAKFGSLFHRRSSSMTNKKKTSDDAAAMAKLMNCYG